MIQSDVNFIFSNFECDIFFQIFFIKPYVVGCVIASIYPQHMLL